MTKRGDEWIGRVIPSSDSVPPIDVVFKDVADAWQALAFGLVTTEPLPHEDLGYLLDCLIAWAFITERGAFGGPCVVGRRLFCTLGRLASVSQQ